jgi:MFS family permease
VATALGTLNFSGDLGKLLGPLVVGVIVVQWGWRVALFSVGLITAFLSIALLFLKRTEPSQHEVQAGKSVEMRAVGQLSWQFVVLLVAGSLDSATRGAALTFLPFIFSGQGMGAPEISLLFGVIFAAGALGKFLCGWLGDRWGIVAVIITTELITAGSLAGFLAVALPLSVPLALVFGFALNGTSSALMTAVTHFVPAHRRARGYGIYFTATLVSSAVAPLAYGVLGDRAGLPPVFLLMSALTAVIVLVVLPIRRTLSIAH